MDQTSKEYKRLGLKTFLIFLFRRIGIVIIIWLVIAALLYGFRFVPTEFASYAILVLQGAIVFGVIVVIAAFILAWFEYMRYGIQISNDFLKVTRGVFAQEEVGIPYNRIKEIKLERSVFDQFLGLSNIFITILGEEAGVSFSKESVISLPALDKNIATQIQNEVLQKTDIQITMNMSKSSKAN